MEAWMVGRLVGLWVDPSQQGGSPVTEVKQMDEWGKGIHMHEGSYCCIIQNKNKNNLLFSQCARDQTKEGGGIKFAASISSCCTSS